MLKEAILRYWMFQINDLFRTLELSPYLDTCSFRHNMMKFLVACLTLIYVSSGTVNALPSPEDLTVLAYRAVRETLRSPYSDPLMFHSGTSVSSVKHPRFATAP